jgi:hypothetical protein
MSVSLAVLAVIAFLMTASGFLVMVWKAGYWARGFVEAQQMAARAMQEMANGFTQFIGRQAEMNERFENALELFGQRISEIEKAKSDE